MRKKCASCWPFSRISYDSLTTASGCGVGYDILHLRCVFVVEVGYYVVKFRRVLCGVRQSRLSFQLRETHGGLFGPKRHNENTDAVERKRRIGRLLRPCRRVCVLLHDVSRRQNVRV